MPLPGKVKGEVRTLITDRQHYRQTHDFYCLGHQELRLIDLMVDHLYGVWGPSLVWI